jgi:hypothetical protein
MKKMVKKLTLHRETVCALSDLRSAIGAVDTQAKTVCFTLCQSNCVNCTGTRAC